MAGDVLRRVQMMSDAERAPAGPFAGALGMLRLLHDVILLLKDLVAAPVLPRRTKVLVGAAVAYLASPVDLVPDWVPVLGQADDVVVALLVLRRVLAAAGYEEIYRLWRGSDEGLAVVLTLAGVEK